MSGVSFYEFLMSHIDDDTPYGDLAQDTKRDSRIKKPVTHTALRSHMRNVGACYEAMDALEALIKEWRASNSSTAQSK